MNDQEKQLEKLESDDLYLQAVKKRTLTFPIITEYAIKNTHESDWVQFGDNPWLRATGAERIARAFGFTVKETRFERLGREDEKGKYYIYIYYGKVGLDDINAWIDAIGTCSSRKSFHWLDHGKERPMSEVLETNILKDAYSNLLENGVTRFLGIRGLTWEILEDHGISREKVSTVSFGGKGQKKAPPRSPKTTSQKKQPPKTEPSGQKGQGSFLDEDQMKEKLRSEILQIAENKFFAPVQEIRKALPVGLTVNQYKKIKESIVECSGDLKLKDFEGFVNAGVYIP